MDDWIVCLTQDQLTEQTKADMRPWFYNAVRTYLRAGCDIAAIMPLVPALEPVLRAIAEDVVESGAIDSKTARREWLGLTPPKDIGLDYCPEVLSRTPAWQFLRRWLRAHQPRPTITRARQ